MSSTRKAAERIAREWFENPNVGDDEAFIEYLAAALQHREQEVRERIIRVLGADKVADLAHHAIGVWQAFEESHLFNNTPENGQRIRGAVDDARDIASVAQRIRRDSQQEGEQSNGK